jgi:hypothetical protein
VRSGIGPIGAEKRERLLNDTRIVLENTKDARECQGSRDWWKFELKHV